MAKETLLAATLCILACACSKNIVSSAQYVGQLPSGESVLGDFVVRKQGILPLMTIAAIPDSPTTDLWALDETEVWPEQAVVTFCDSEGVLVQWVSDVSSVNIDDEMGWHRPGRETDLTGPISYSRDFQRFSDLWEKNQSDFDGVDLLGELIPDGDYAVEIRWHGFEPSSHVRHYEIYFYNRRWVPRWRLWF